MTSKGQRKNRGGLGARRYARARAQNERVQRSWERRPQLSDERWSTKLISVCNVFLRNTGCTGPNSLWLASLGRPGELREGGKGGARGTACFGWIQSGW